MITNCEEGKGKTPRLFPKTGYPLGYPEPALQQKTEERERSAAENAGLENEGPNIWTFYGSAFFGRTLSDPDIFVLHFPGLHF